METSLALRCAKKDPASCCCHINQLCTSINREHRAKLHHASGFPGHNSRDPSGDMQRSWHPMGQSWMHSVGVPPFCHLANNSGPILHDSSEHPGGVERSAGVTNWRTPPIGVSYLPVTCFLCDRKVSSQNQLPTLKLLAQLFSEGGKPRLRHSLVGRKVGR